MESFDSLENKLNSPTFVTTSEDIKIISTGVEETYMSRLISKLKWLKEKWSAMPDDYEETRLIGPILSHKLNIVNATIIADYLSYFKKKYEKNSRQKLQQYLVLACLSGSKRVGEFLLNELKVSCTTEGYEFVLSYVSSSNNAEWAKEIATTMAEAKNSMPSDVYLFCQNELALDIEEIFVKNDLPFQY